MSTTRTVERLAAEEAEVARLERAEPQDAMALTMARGAAQLTKRLLQANGILPYEPTPAVPAREETVERQLDRLFPSARNRSEVTLAGQRYRRRFAPTQKAADGRVLGWTRTWERVES